MKLITGRLEKSRKLESLKRPSNAPSQLVVSMVPYCQIRERNYETHDGGEYILSIVASSIEEVSLQVLNQTIFSLSEVKFDLTDDEYAQVVQDVIENEICKGEGANFLISRKGLARIDGFSNEVAIEIFRRLITNEPNAYMGFLFYDGEKYFIGASPERHITMANDVVTMNPISGTIPKTELKSKTDLINFLNDEKEINELFQVVDEELKMMSKICPEGGTVSGPFLKEMSSVIHTEYILEGISTLDKLEAFKTSMFAATMIGSPLESAARVIKKYEKDSRRYYSSALVLHGTDEEAREYLDTAITIRTLEIQNSGEVRIQSGGTIVRDSSPEKETAEAKAKVAGVIRAMSTAVPSGEVLPDLVDDEISELLVSRNRHLSSFWVNKQIGESKPINTNRKSIFIIDNEDEFTFMLKHLLEHLGHDVEIERYETVDIKRVAADIVIVGPGPGDPNNLEDPKMRKIADIVEQLFSTKQKFMAVCLGHQVVCRHLGFSVEPIDPPLQGVQVDVDLFGKSERVGFYNTFFARNSPAANTEHDVTVAQNLDHNLVSIRGDFFSSFQFHVESVLTSNGAEILANELSRLA